jgi:hypothetical protein
MPIRAAISKARTLESTSWNLPVDQGDLEVDHREAGQRTAVHDRLDALFDAGDVFLRHGTADDLRLERIAFARLGRRDDQLDLGELTRTTRLLLVGVGRCSILWPMVSR